MERTGRQSEQESGARMDGHLAHWRRHGFGRWVFCEKASKQIVGYCGLRRRQIGERAEIDIGYSVLPEHWGKGFATEMARAVLALGFDKLRFTEIVGIALPGNLPSRRVLEKIGLRYEREAVLEGMAFAVYRISREQWAHK